MKFSTTLSILVSATLVSAHGYVQNVTIGGKTYGGWLPFDSPYTSPATKSIVRNIRDDGPVTTITDPAMACNFGGEKAAALIADANAGDEVKFVMNRWPDDHLGPVTVWMANCGASCSSFDPSSGDVWFKIDEAGLTNGQWATSKLIAQGDSWTVSIPSGLKAGQYLIRLEILALHSAGAPQFYPSCSQLNVNGSGSDVPGKSDLVAIPGVYANAGQAIYGDIWESPKTWPLAGPRPVSFASGSGGNDSPSPASSSTVAATSSHSLSATHRPTSTRAPGGVGGTPSSAVPTTTSKAAQPTGKQCRRSVKRSQEVSASEIYQRALEERRASGQATVPDRRAWSSHSKAKRARGLLRI